MTNEQQHYSRHSAAVDDSMVFSAEHQRHLANTAGGKPTWRTRSDGILEFLTPRGIILPARLHPIGTVSANNDSWTWAWATDKATEASQRILKYGKKSQTRLFATPTIELRPGDTVTPLSLITGTKVIHRIWYHLRLPHPDGTATYAALHIPALTLPTATQSASAQAIVDAHTSLTPRRPLRAAASYANLRELTRYQTSDGKHVRLAHPGWTLDLTATAHGLQLSRREAATP